MLKKRHAGRASFFIEILGRSKYFFWKSLPS